MLSASFLSSGFSASVSLGGHVHQLLEKELPRHLQLVEEKVAGERRVDVDGAGLLKVDEQRDRLPIPANPFLAVAVQEVEERLDRRRPAAAWPRRCAGSASAGRHASSRVIRGQHPRQVAPHLVGIPGQHVRAAVAGRRRGSSGGRRRRRPAPAPTSPPRAHSVRNAAASSGRDTSVIGYRQLQEPGAISESVPARPAWRRGSRSCRWWSGCSAGPDAPAAR